MATGNPYDLRSRDVDERNMAKRWERGERFNPYDKRSEDPSERAAAKQWEREQRQTFAQGAGIDYTPGLLTGSGGGIGGNERGISVARSVDNYLNQWANNKHPDFPTLNITPEQRAQVLQQVAANPEGGFLQYLTPEQRQVAQTMLTFNEQNAGFDPMQKALMAGGLAGFAALAGPSLFGAAGAEAGGTVGGLSASDAALIDAANAGAAGAGATGGGAVGGLGGLTTTELGTALANAGDWAALDTLAGVPAGATYGAESLALGAGGLTADTAAALNAGGTGGFDIANYVKTGVGLPGGAIPTPPMPSPGLFSGLAPAVTGSVLSRIMDGTATADDWGKIASGAITGIGGLYAANQQAGAYEDLANRGWAEGAPSRARYEASFAPDFDLLQADPLLRGGLDTAANTAARAWSARAGNPAENPTAQAEIQKYLLGSVYLPQGNTYRSQNATSGQFGTNLAGTASGAAINAQGGGWEALGSGIESILNPRQRYTNQTGGVLSNLALNTGRYL